MTAVLYNACRNKYMSMNDRKTNLFVISTKSHTPVLLIFVYLIIMVC